MKTSSLFFTALVLAALASSGVAQTVNITATDADAAETAPGDAPNPGSIQVTRSGSTIAALTVWVRVSGIALQGTDYVFGNTIGDTVIIPAGSSTLNIPVTPTDDWLIEGAEDVRIKLESKTASGAAVPYTIGLSDRAIVDIADNEDPLLPRAVVTVETLDALGSETVGGTDRALFRITRTNNLSPALEVLYTLGGTATAGLD